ncbi:hypothetical protein LTR32_004350 [Rachicladosporium monterosium]|uniref:Epidermal growth factor receptor-like transmembrane-juxtamembrane segment domain-containing protein n=1 Tax=Rachicladosporium monterosium TaxID=1507873 RepID=A0ABR0L4U6_9PEZI|nr:hypothetical protein LTR32_004350 [Rachicladosporium monterosium]
MLSPAYATTVRLLLASLLLHGAAGQEIQDQINNFCRRFAHQTTVIGNRLYVDGGLLDYGGSISAGTVNYTNTLLSYLDLDSLYNNFPIEYANLSKPNNVPSVQGGILWADTVNKLFYLYGGEHNWTSQPPAQYTLWAYDAIYNVWNDTTQDASASGIQSVSFGAGTVVDDDRALGFYYGGWLSNATVLGWNGNALAQSGLVQYDMLRNIWSNVTFIDSTPRAEGVMQVLIFPVQIYLYDLASGLSYTQTTSGNAPNMRRRFCGGVSWPKDQSSYNIYVYGGLPPYDQQGVGYGDVWILSMPSFTWTQWYPTLNGSVRLPTSPSEHHSLSCNVIEQSQMIIMGGYFPNSSNIGCDARAIWGQHNLNLGAEDVQQAAWYQYLPNVTSYQVPSTVVASSEEGFVGLLHQDLLRHFADSYPGRIAFHINAISERHAPPPPVNHSEAGPIAGGVVGAGPIAGGVVGGVIFLALVVFVVWVCLRRRNKHREATSETQQHGAMTELPSPGSPESHHKRNISGSTAPTVSPLGASPPPPPFDASHWSQAQHPGYAGPQYAGQSAQAFYPPPPQAQQYYPPPPPPAQYEQPPSPISEMPSVRSPMAGTPARRAAL